MTQIRTIIVDDEGRIRRGIERMVRSLGEEWEIVGTFSDGLEVYEAVVNESISFDLLISDIKMPEMDGLTLNKKLKEHLSFLTIFISGYDDFEYLQTAMRDGAVNYILKPIDKEQFHIQMDEVKQKIQTVQEEKQEWITMQEKASQLEYTKQLQRLSEMTWNEEKDILYLDWTREFPNGWYQLIHMSVDQIYSKTKEYLPEDWNNWSQRIEQLLEELVEADIRDQQIDCWWWRGSKFSYWLLLHFEDKNDKGEISLTTGQFAQQIGVSIQKITPFTASVALGHKFNDLALFGNMKNELLTLLQFRMIQGGNRVFQAESFHDIKIQKSKGISSSILKYTEQVITSFAQGKKAELLQALQGFFREVETLSSPIMINEAVHYILIGIANYCIENDGYSEDPELLTNALSFTKHAANFIQLKDQVKIWILQVMEKMTRLKKEQHNPIQVAKEWIKDNLGDNISIKKIAQQVYMNPNYFCDYFKNQTGETILDYVTSARLEKAKELLENTDLKIYDISLSVGYQDTKYFSRLFKQWIGQTPSQFRDHFAKSLTK
ncbi:response regulator transcription factor [Neobacillus cucumis]|uniref:response regulator transcription factor n=1 Tax=Neobacillus cucumis TaxID=1740721 RepID=UPI00285368EA|nr:helix-turn-helix domain-containing protein [Neobacillus cucumis]MDR4946137.1 AraC family transcriptional regulator [Neobacillus cucumis]